MTVNVFSGVVNDGATNLQNALYVKVIRTRKDLVVVEATFTFDIYLPVGRSPSFRVERLQEPSVVHPRGSETA